jgi:hypothetical protein
MTRRGDVQLLVTVTTEDIVCGERSDCWECPLALALTRAVGESVHVDKHYISDGGGGWYRDLPSEAVRFQRRFDAGRAVEPFAFTIWVPGHYVVVGSGKGAS